MSKRAQADHLRAHGEAKAPVVRQRETIHITLSPEAKAAGLAEVERRNSVARVQIAWNLSRVIDDALLKFTAFTSATVLTAGEPVTIGANAVRVLNAAEKAIASGADLSAIVGDVRAIRKAVVGLLAAMQEQYANEAENYAGDMRDWAPTSRANHGLVRLDKPE
jgi:hypothetical protein